MANRLTLVKGDTAKLRFEIINPGDSSPVNLTTFEVLTFTIKRSTQDTDAAALWQGSLATNDITIDDTVTARNVMDVVVPKEATDKFLIGRLYYWDIEIADVDGQSFSPLVGTILPTLEATLG